MKKLTSLCLFIVLLFTSLLVINIYQTKDKININSLEMTPSSFNFYIKNSNKTLTEELTFLTELAKQEEVAIFRTDREDNVVIKSVIFNQQAFPFENFNLQPSDLFTNQNHLYASYSLNSSKQKGNIPTFDQRNKILLQTLTNYYQDSSKSLNGTYSIVSTKAFNKKQVLNHLTTFFEVSEKELLTEATHTAVGFVNKDLMIFSGLLMIFLLILTLVTIYTPLTEIKAIGVMKLNGLSDSLILSQFLKTNIAIIIGTASLINISCLFYFKVIPKYFLISLIFAQSSLLILFFSLNFLTYLIIRKVTISNMLANFFDFKFGIWLCFLLKGAITILLTLLMMQISNTFDALMKQYYVNQSWQAQGDYLTLENYQLSGDDYQGFLLNNGHLEKKIARLLPELEEQLNGFYVNSDVYLAENYLNDADSKLSYEPTETFQVMQINYNFLESLALADQLKQKTGRQFLIPKSYKSREETLRYFCQQLLFENLSPQEQHQTLLTELPINFSYYDDYADFSVFTYNSDSLLTFDKPILMVFDNTSTDSFETMLLTNTGLSNPLKIKNTAANREALQQIIVEEQLTDLNLKFSTINSILGDQVSSLKMSITIFSLVLVAVFLLTICASLFLLGCLIQSKKQKVAVYRLLGFNLFDRYALEIIIFASLYVIQLLTLLFLADSFIALPYGLLMLLIDLVITITGTLSLEKQNLARLLKGE